MLWNIISGTESVRAGSAAAEAGERVEDEIRRDYVRSIARHDSLPSAGRCAGGR